jgi:hypothetical protein
VLSLSFAFWGLPVLFWRFSLWLPMRKENRRGNGGSSEIRGTRVNFAIAEIRICAISAISVIAVIVAIAGTASAVAVTTTFSWGSCALD